MIVEIKNLNRVLLFCDRDLVQILKVFLPSPFSNCSVSIQTNHKVRTDMSVVAVTTTPVTKFK
jgi:hypothetical protein